ncbi:1692_t:CDS:2 [Ambispora gerdemannii]|uniref:1692_t:CDS:1 n=1 Tax=Ambispora gerdemannii TaxID=144530 RepID=A0A9N9BCC0_9GLOM|nr:1692_t:CDS:2 [Ambispora gerdemannii]
MFDERAYFHNSHYHSPLAQHHYDYFDQEPVTNLVFEGGCFLFVLFSMGYLIYAYFIRPRGSPLELGQRITGREPWTRNYIYPNHWRAGTITGVVEKTGIAQNALTPNQSRPATSILNCTTITYIILYWMLVISLSWIWGLLFMPASLPTQTKTVVPLPTPTTTSYPATTTFFYHRTKYQGVVGNRVTVTTTYTPPIIPEKLPDFY